MRFEQVCIRLAPGDPALVPGQYAVLDAGDVDRAVSGDRWCPYCEAPLVEYAVRTGRVGRVATADAPPVQGVQVVGVDVVPASARLLKCQACDQFFAAGDGEA